jgi:hypothetical protein
MKHNKDIAEESINAGSLIIYESKNLIIIPNK